MSSVIIMLIGYTRFLALSGGGDIVVRNPYHYLRRKGEGIKITMSFYGARNRERWGILTYDKYNNTVGDMGVYTKTTLYTNMPSFIGTYAKKSFSVSLAYIPLLNFDYKYESNLKDATYLPSNNYDIRKTGGFNLLGIGAEGRYKKFYGGTYIGYGKGSIEETVFYSDTTIENKEDLKGFVPYIYVGASLENISASIGFNPRVSLSSNPFPVYPMSIYTEVSLFRPSPLMDKVILDFIYRFYKKSGYVTDGFTFLAGLKHTAFNNFYFSLKAGVEKSYKEENTYIPLYAIKMGQSFHGMEVFAKMEYRPIKYSSYDSSSQEFFNISENTLRFKLGLTINP